MDLLAALVLLVVSALFKLLSPSSATSYELLPTNVLLQAITATARKNITGDKLSACAKANGSVSAPFSPGLHIRSVILGFELGGMNYINQIWNLTGPTKD